MVELAQRHGRRCTGTARCKCPWVARVYVREDDRQLHRTFPSRAAAKAWRDDRLADARRGRLRAPATTTLPRGRHRPPGGDGERGDTQPVGSHLRSGCSTGPHRGRSNRRVGTSTPDRQARTDRDAAEAVEPIAALPTSEQAIWACALYAGLSGMTARAGTSAVALPFAPPRSPALLGTSRTLRGNDRP
jgi:hypothetical protein